MKKHLLLLLFLVFSCLLGFSSCTCGYPVTEDGVMNVYADRDNGGWAFVYKDKIYHDLNAFPNKNEVNKIVVTSRVPSEDKQALGTMLSQTFGDKTEVVYLRDIDPVIIRRPLIIPRLMVF